jgi:hypothetical protein
MHTVYSGKVYIGQTKRNTDIRCKEQMRHLPLGQPEKLAIAEHVPDIGNNMEFSNTRRLVTTNGYMDRLVTDATEIKLHPNNINKDSGFILSRAWQSMLEQIENTSNQQQ